MARDYLTPKMAPQYRSPHVQSDYNRYQQPPAKKTNGLPSNKVVAPGTGPGTGRTTLGIGWQNRDGSFSPLTAMGSPTGPLTQPMPRMQTNTADAMLAKRADNFKRAVADGTAAQKIYDYNKANPHLYMDAGGNIMPKNNSSGFDVPTNGNGERIAPQGSSGAGNDIPLDGKGGYAKSESPLTTPSSTAGQAQSMRDSMAPPPGQDRYGRTSASPSAGGRPVAPPPSNTSSSARGDWQQGTPGTRFRSDMYGKGSSKPFTQQDTVRDMAEKKRIEGEKSSIAENAKNSSAPGTADKQPAPAYTPKPSAVPADRLQKYSDAAAQIKENATKAAAEKASAPAANPMMSGKLPSSTPAASAASTPSVKPLMPGAGFTGPAGEAAARMAKQNAAEAAPTTASAPTPPPATQPSGPSEQDIKAQEEKAAASQRGYIGNTAKAVGDTAAKVGGAVVDTTKAVVDAVPKIAGQVVDAGQKTTSQMIEGAKKGFAQMGKDAFGTNDATAETRKLEEMKKQAAGRATEMNGRPYKSPLAADMGLPPPGQNGPMDTAAKNAARGFDDTADLARYKAEDATTPKGDAQIADEEEDPNLKE